MKTKLNIIYANQAQLIANIIVDNQSKKKNKINTYKLIARYYTPYMHINVFTEINTTYQTSA